MNPNGESRLDRMERMIETMRARRAEHEVRRPNLDDALPPLAADAAKAELRHRSQMAWIRRVTRIAEKVLARHEERLDEGTNGNN